MDNDATEVGKRLKEAGSVLFITGAGISAESGLPTYRGFGGLYQRKTTDEGIPIEQALSIDQFRKNPAVIWKHLEEIDNLRRGKKPNQAHLIIAELEHHFDVTVLTQNIDGFHRRAGSSNLIEIHGDLNKVFCPSCDWSDEVETFTQLPTDYLCPKCSKPIATDVVLFNQELGYENVMKLNELSFKKFDIIFVIGTTALFPYVSEPIVNNKGALTVEINLEETYLSEIVDKKIHLPATKALQAVMKHSGIKLNSLS